MNTQIYLEIYDTISMLIRLATPQSVLCTVTTGRYFAVCQRHTANALPCVAHGKVTTATKRREKASLPWVFCRAHGKTFAVC